MEHGRNRPAPERLVEVSDRTRRFLDSLDDHDLDRIEWLLRLDHKKIERFEKWDDTLAFWGRFGRFGSGVIYALLALLGAVVTIKQVWDIFFPGKP